MSAVTGDLGTSPIDSTAITGFALIADATNTFSTSAQVTGKIYAADYAAPTPANLTTAVSNMETAYADAAGRTLPDFTELYSGNLSGRTLAPGLYKWSTGVLITSNLTLAGAAPGGVWIFQIAGDLTLGSGANVRLGRGAEAANIFWQVGGPSGADIGTTAHIEGTILAAKAIHFRTNASINGRALAQTAVTLQRNVVVLPAPAGGPVELIVNGGFEAGLAPWVPSDFGPGDGVNCRVALAGRCALALNGRHTIDGQTEGRTWVRQQIAGQLAATFQFSASSTANNARLGTRARYRAVVSFKLKDGGTEFRYLDFDRGSHGWQTLSTAPFMIPATSRTLVEIDYFDQTGMARFDELSLTLTPQL